MLYIFTSWPRAIKHLVPNFCLAFVSLTAASCERSDQNSTANDHRLGYSRKQEINTGDNRTPIPVGLAEVTTRLPHDPKAFTQGFQYWDGVFIESTGGYGTSSIRLVDPESGRVLKRYDLPFHQFGEGCAWTPDGIVQLTWRNRIAFRYHPETLEKVASYDYPREGWGLIYNGEYLWASDGSDTLYRLDPESLQKNHQIKVRTEDGRPIDRINEMAWIEGIILANIFMENYIVAIDPESGYVLRKWDLSEIVEDEQPRNREHVLNGIAYDPADGRLWITGKQWRHVYQIELPNMPSVVIAN